MNFSCSFSENIAREGISRREEHLGIFKSVPDALTVLRSLQDAMKAWLD